MRSFGRLRPTPVGGAAAREDGNAGYDQDHPATA
jgi:hypothetical protein